MPSSGAIERLIADSGLPVAALPVSFLP